MQNKKQKGYTLLEVLVVVVIVGILATVSVPIYNKVIERSRVSDALHNIDMLSGAQAKYFVKTGSYANSLAKLDVNAQSDNLVTKNFTYHLGDSVNGDYCIYADNNSEDYTLARNYRTNSPIRCSGSFCDKVDSFVEPGEVEDICEPKNTCDKICSIPWTLNTDKCQCECKLKQSDCAEGKTLNLNTCSCEEDNSCNISCEYPLVPNQDPCECRCGLTQSNCADGEDVNTGTCTCQCNKTSETCQTEHGGNANWRKKEGECSCECGITQSDCAEGETFNSTACSCECGVTNATCQEEHDGNANWRKKEGQCACECGLTKNDCTTNETFNSTNCSCDCNKTNESCQTEHGGNQYWIKATDGSCNCECNLAQANCGDGTSPNLESCSCDANECPPGQVPIPNSNGQCGCYLTQNSPVRPITWPTMMDWEYVNIPQGGGYYTVDPITMCTNYGGQWTSGHHGFVLQEDCSCDCDRVWLEQLCFEKGLNASPFACDCESTSCLGAGCNSL